ncbi:O-methyltransferase, partial [Lutimonas sp.]|uniref:O-methyltransferase n=1 Tax=Lutimonas sp. TaxID=1872403 RepID=UPI003D9BC63F
IKKEPLLHSIQAYFKYLIASKNQYGVHSPFLFDYLTKGLMQDQLIPIDKAVLFRKNVRSDRREIQVTDFGAGSKIFKDGHRQISKIAATAGMTSKRGTLLAKTTSYFKPKNILEIGTSLGISTAFMHVGAPNAKITTLEGCPSTATIAKEYFDNCDFKNIEVVTGEFNSTLDGVLKNKNYDLIFFDGNHQKQPTLDYFKKCLTAAHESSVFIFDDIHWSKEMESAWEEIKNHPKVTLTADTFKWGLVFFSKGREKQHFTLRI